MARINYVSGEWPEISAAELKKIYMYIFTSIYILTNFPFFVNL